MSFKGYPMSLDKEKVSTVIKLVDIISNIVRAIKDRRAKRKERKDEL